MPLYMHRLQIDVMEMEGMKSKDEENESEIIGGRQILQSEIDSKVRPSRVDP